MTAEEHIAQLEMELAKEQAKTARVEAELAAERAENASLRQQMEHILARLREVEGQLAKDSYNSSKPPSSDGPGRKLRSQRHRSEPAPMRCCVIGPWSAATANSGWKESQER